MIKIIFIFLCFCHNAYATYDYDLDSFADDFVKNKEATSDKLYEMAGTETFRGYLADIFKIAYKIHSLLESSANSDKLLKEYFQEAAQALGRRFRRYFLTISSDKPFAIRGLVNKNKNKLKTDGLRPSLYDKINLGRIEETANFLHQSFLQALKTDSKGGEVIAERTFPNIFLEKGQWPDTSSRSFRTVIKTGRSSNGKKPTQLRTAKEVNLANKGQGTPSSLNNNTSVTEQGIPNPIQSVRVKQAIVKKINELIHEIEKKPTPDPSISTQDVQSNSLARPQSLEVESPNGPSSPSGGTKDLKDRLSVLRRDSSSEEDLPTIEPKGTTTTLSSRPSSRRSSSSLEELRQQFENMNIEEERDASQSSSRRHSTDTQARISEQQRRSLSDDDIALEMLTSAIQQIASERLSALKENNETYSLARSYRQAQERLKNELKSHLSVSRFYAACTVATRETTGKITKEEASERIYSNGDPLFPNERKSSIRRSQPREAIQQDPGLTDIPSELEQMIQEEMARQRHLLEFHEKETHLLNNGDNIIRNDSRSATRSLRHDSGPSPELRPLTPDTLFLPPENSINADSSTNHPIQSSSPRRNSEMSSSRPRSPASLQGKGSSSPAPSSDNPNNSNASSISSAQLQQKEDGNTSTTSVRALKEHFESLTNPARHQNTQ